MDCSDRQLIRNIRNGDARSFEELFDRYYDRLYAFALALLHDCDVAEDVLQNVFMRLWIGRERLDETRSVSNYLLVSVRNEIYDYFSLKYTSAVIRSAAPPENKEDESADMEKRIMCLDMSDTINRIIAHMPPQRQRVFIMSRYQGMSSLEISKELDISVRTVERHIHLALKELRHLLS